MALLPAMATATATLLPMEVPPLLAWFEGGPSVSALDLGLILQVVAARGKA